MLGDVGLTTASGTDSRTGASFSAGENIFGPFEAGFGSTQDNILSRLGCNPGSLGHVAGGIDTNTAEQMVAHQCSISLPRVEGGSYISLLDECGGHTREYHFHERLSCLYETGDGIGHSTVVGQGNDLRYLYGKWEDFSTGVLPKLDACGGHFGVTPDHDVRHYHYHMQDSPPFTFGCYGPKIDGESHTLVDLATCRGLYSGCGNGDTVTVGTPNGNRQYDLWCPCFDADVSNVGSRELPVFSEAASVTSCQGPGCGTKSAEAPVFVGGTAQASLGGVAPVLLLLAAARFG